MKQHTPGLWDWSILLLLALIWGFSYYFIKHSLTGFKPDQIASLRMVFSSIALLPFLPSALKIVPKEKYYIIAFVGIIGSFLPAYLYPFAQQKISSSVAGIINAFTPICTYGLGVLFFSVRNEKTKFIGTAIALIGAFCLILLRPNAELKAEAFFLFVAFTVPILYGINGNTIKSKLQGIPGTEMTTLMYLFTLIICIPACFINGSFQQIPISLAQDNSFYHLLALSLLGSALAMTLFNILIQRVHVLFASSVTYLMPLVAIIVGWMDGESILWNDLVGFLCILIGVLITNEALKFGSKAGRLGL
ncbi:MAG: EamA family transporter [Saprospiraceae bacterium]|nr:EamA family transporter [Saprospiraceae bacterium]